MIESCTTSTAMHKMALIIPYRNREEHLAEFLHSFPPKMKELCPAVDYHIFIIEQTPGKSFNRGKLLNVGFILTQGEFDYFCFHDVDMLPTSADYSFPNVPTHLAADVSQFREWIGKGLAYKNYFGGVVLFNKADFERINGYSNQYWGYGIEDDDLIVRVVESGLSWIRRPGIYESLSHDYSGGTPEHHANKARFINILKELESDPSGLSDLDFKVIKKETFSNYSHYLIDI
ncbi:udpgalactose-glucose galactosyltransferase [Candidatus Protochlamydia naegleriophila]|uniref:Udpgalactose-glucose galactosyltransferase n=1 Tax=Candidatus Protochlamydia naegleriophila TaxID=389348 RepID=A0A0U5J7B8_9BACT|nr:galactosyltransferase-related protein [Candidatus Protochlamydia naegleriophila]CUI15977.1 udpgalactose-glucose galactosyltransferase [Candidatus Protochlamydia naegleriophila]